MVTSEQEEEENHDGRVSEVEEGRGRSFDLQLGDEVVDAVDEQVERGEAAGQVTAPPPVIVLESRAHNFSSGWLRIILLKYRQPINARLTLFSSLPY